MSTVKDQIEVNEKISVEEAILDLNSMLDNFISGEDDRYYIKIQEVIDKLEKVEVQRSLLSYASYKDIDFVIDQFDQQPGCERPDCTFLAVKACTTDTTNCLWLLCNKDAKAMENGEIWW